ncbi:hypothetical protein QR680_008374 [Steinernema hermaphroditum]|uniref:Insulin-like domain-containing protein n=1 Tax=Steinernema hermaphroditum TaxID=289476 RepID=A0AA39IGE8_9BILA|nr:hypothetical protein QR680_008374 [Steinernema hermaphroditum]
MKLLALLLICGLAVAVKSKALAVVSPHAVGDSKMYKLPKSEWDMGISHIFKDLSTKTMSIKQRICGPSLLTAINEVCLRGYNLRRGSAFAVSDNYYQIRCCKKGCTLNEVKEFFCL